MLTQQSGVAFWGVEENNIGHSMRTILIDKDLKLVKVYDGMDWTPGEAKNDIEKILKIKPELKWPNDVTLKGKKIAGILIDTSIVSNEIENMVLGIGINFKIKPHELANTIKKTPNFYGVATLVKKNESALPLVQQFLYELENIFQLINSGRIKKIKNGWTKRSSTIGRSISIITNEGNLNGKAVKIDNDGALIISKGKKIERILVGDITHDQ